MTIATFQPLYSLADPFQGTILGYRKNHILGTGRLESATVTYVVGGETLIQANHTKGDSFQSHHTAAYRNHRCHKRGSPPSSSPISHHVKYTGRYDRHPYDLKEQRSPADCRPDKRSLIMDASRITRLRLKEEGLHEPVPVGDISMEDLRFFKHRLLHAVAMHPFSLHKHQPACSSLLLDKNEHVVVRGDGLLKTAGLLGYRYRFHGMVFPALLGFSIDDIGKKIECRLRIAFANLYIFRSGYCLILLQTKTSLVFLGTKSTITAAI